MATLTSTKIKNTYDALLKATDNDAIGSTAKQITDGLGNGTPLYISTSQIGIGVTPEATYDLHVYSNAKVGGNLTVTGDLTVDGTVTTVSSETLTVTDPLIELAKDNTSTDALDIGFYGKYAPSGTTLYAGLFRDTGDDKFKLFKSLEEAPTTTVNTSGTGYAVATLVANLEGIATLADTSTAITQSQNDNSTKVATTAYVDLAIDGIDTLAEILAIGNTTGGTDISVSSGDDITFADDSKSIYGASSDLKIYHNTVDEESSIIEAANHNLKIINTANDSNIVLQTDDGSGSITNYLIANGFSGAVELYHYGSKKLETSSTGVTVTGQLNLGDYGSGTYTGTATYRLAVDSSGDVIEIPIGDGAVDGSGATGQVAFWTDTDTIDGENNLYWDSTNDRLGIGTDSPDKKLHIVDTSAGSVTYPLRLQNSGTTTGTDVGLIFTTKTSGGGSASSVIRSESEDTSGNSSLVFTTPSGGSTAERMRIDSSGNVGIGTDSPATGYKLQVKRDTNVNIGFGLQNSGASLEAVNDAVNANIPFSLYGSKILLLNGDVGINTTSPTEKLFVGTGNIGLNDAYALKWGSVYIDGVDASDILRFYTSSTERVRVDSSGVVQVRNQTPTIQLYNTDTSLGSNQTLGDIDWYQSDASSAGVGVVAKIRGVNNSTFSGVGELAFHTGTASSISERLRIDNSGNCGIGTTSPSRPLHIAGSSGTAILEIQRTNTNTTGAVGVVQFNASDDDALAAISVVGDGDNEGGHLVFRTTSAASDNNYFNSTTERMRVTSGGEVYIAGTSDQGAYNLQVNGTGVWGAGAYVNGSDKRLKEDIKPLENAIDVINKIKPVTYKYKESYSKDKSTQTGFIAQELLEALEGQIYKDGIVKTDSEYMNVAYQNIIALLVKSTQELKEEIETLKAQINN